MHACSGRLFGAPKVNMVLFDSLCKLPVVLDGAAVGFDSFRSASSDCLVLVLQQN